MLGGLQRGIFALVRSSSPGHKQSIFPTMRIGVSDDDESCLLAEQWEAVLEGPPSAGMIVATAARGGMIRESIALSKACIEAAPSTGRANSSTRSSRRSLR